MVLEQDGEDGVCCRQLRIEEQTERSQPIGLPLTCGRGQDRACRRTLELARLACQAGPGDGDRDRAETPSPVFAPEPVLFAGVAFDSEGEDEGR